MRRLAPPGRSISSPPSSASGSSYWLIWKFFGMSG